MKKRNVFSSWDRDQEGRKKLRQRYQRALADTEKRIQLLADAMLGEFADVAGNPKHRELVSSAARSIRSVRNGIR